MEKMKLLLMLFFCLLGFNQMNAQTDNTSAIVQEIAAQHDLTIYPLGTITKEDLTTILGNQVPTNKAEIVYYEAVSSDVELRDRAPEEALILNLRYLGEYVTSSADIKTLYNNTVTMMQ